MRNTTILLSCLALGFSTAACAASSDDPGADGDSATVTDVSEGLTAVDLHVKFKPPQRMDPPSAAARAGKLVPGVNGTPGDQTPLVYHAGPIMNRQNVYAIYYGDWSTQGRTQALHASLFRAFAQDSFESDYVHVFPYRDRFGGLAGSQGYGFGGAISVGAPYGMSLDDGAYASLVQQVLWQGKLPFDPNGLYLVFPSRYVHSAGEESYCGWHTTASMRPTSVTSGTTAIKFGMIAHTSNAVAGGGNCSAFRLGDPYPNGDYVADSQATVIAHEMAETLTDPELTAWWNPTLADEVSEVGDKCAWYFPNSRPLLDGAIYNLHDRAADRYWLLQAEYANGCSMGGPGRP